MDEENDLMRRLTGATTLLPLDNKREWRFRRTGVSSSDVIFLSFAEIEPLLSEPPAENPLLFGSPD